VTRLQELRQRVSDARRPAVEAEMRFLQELGWACLGCGTDIDGGDTEGCRVCSDRRRHRERRLEAGVEPMRLTGRRWNGAGCIQRRPAQVHGTAHSYRVYACRCPDCYAAEAKLRKDWRNKRKADGWFWRKGKLRPPADWVKIGGRWSPPKGVSA
jgi:hypothetical protein